MHLANIVSKIAYEYFQIGEKAINLANPEDGEVIITDKVVDGTFHYIEGICKGKFRISGPANFFKKK